MKDTNDLNNLNDLISNSDRPSDACPHCGQCMSDSPLLKEAKPKVEETSASKYPALALDDIFQFGKHKGSQVEDVIEDHPDYIEWLIKNEVREFDEEAMQRFTREGII